MPALKTLDNVSLHSPNLWICRLVVLKAPLITEENVIHDIQLHRGLNIVLGCGEAHWKEGERPDFSQSGHSVGKSSFCRLIRYILNEPSLGSDRFEHQLKKAWPHGWVAAELMIKNQLWAVGKSFSKNRSPLIGRAVNAETIFSSDFTSLGKSDYETALADLLPTDLNLPDRQFTWLDVLAWLTRDQNARLRNFWSWRETQKDKQQHKNGLFSKSVSQPRHLLMGLLKMLPTESEKLQFKLHELKQSQATIGTDIVSLQNKHKTQIATSRLELMRQLGQSPDPTQNDADESEDVFFNLTQVANDRLQLINQPGGEIDVLMKKLSNSEQEVSRVFPFYHDIRKKYLRHQQLQAMDIERSTALDENSGPKKTPEDIIRENKIRMLEDSLKTSCEYAQIIVNQCDAAITYYNDQKARCNKSTAMNIENQQREDRIKTENEETELRSEAISGENEKIEDEYLKSKLLYDEIETNRKRYKNELERLQQKSETIKTLLATIDCAKEFIDGEKEDPSLTVLIKQQNANDESISNCETKLATAQREATRSQKILQEIYSELIGIFLGPEYGGTIFSKDVLAFQILDNGELSGGVVDTLTVLLGDLSAMLASVLGASHHPGFHLHDSPRETDLSAPMYSWFFEIVADISVQLGGKDKAPFQYIITTTTVPPEKLTPYIRLKLATEPSTAYLFGKKLHSVLEAQPRLPGLDNDFEKSRPSDGGE